VGVMDKVVQGLGQVTKIVFAVVKVLIAFSILLFLADKIFGLKLNIIKLDFVNNISNKEVTIIIVLLLMWLGFKDVK
jgi:hypothetical protein